MLAGKIGDGITAVKDYPPGLPRIPAYPSEVNQVWPNLIDNAVAAMDGHGTLIVRTARDSDKLLVEFADTGPGIAEDIGNPIFEPFFSTKPVGQGYRARTGHLLADRGEPALRRPARRVRFREHACGYGCR